MGVFKRVFQVVCPHVELDWDTVEYAADKVYVKCKKCGKRIGYFADPRIVKYLSNKDG